MFALEYTKPKSDFALTLRYRVKQYLEATGKDRYAQRQTCLVLGLLIVILSVYGTLLLTPLTFATTCMLLTLLGLLLYLGGIHILHEGTHGNLSKNKQLNRFFVLVYDLFVGFSSDQYRFRHLTLHHAFTNVQDLDVDLDTHEVVRLSPYFPLKKRYAFQHFYAFLLYPLGILHIIWVKDIKRFLTQKMGPRIPKKWSLTDGIKLLLSKSIHFCLGILIPLSFFSLGSVLCAYLYVLCVSSLCIALVFQLSHINSKVEFIPGVIQENRMILNENVVGHQLKTTANYAGDSWLLLVLTGGVNLQIEHHLFSNLSFWHLPHVRQIVRQACAEYGIPYQEFPTFRHALSDHFLTLHKLGTSSQPE